MSHRSKIAAAVGLLFFAPAAQAETIGRTLDGKALSIDVACVDNVEIEPDAGLAGQIKVEATSTDPSLLKDFFFAGGAVATVTRDRTACQSFPRQRPKILVSIRMPAGLPVAITNGGSTDYAIGAIGGPLRASLAGSGDVKIESVASLDLDVAGSSDIRVGQANGPADIRIAGAGDVRIAAATMSALKIDIRGSGDVAVERGDVGALAATVAGSGDVRIKAAVKDANLSTVGSGTIDIDKVTGILRSSKAGTGTIRIGHAGPT